MDKVNPNIKPSLGYVLVEPLSPDQVEGIDIVDDSELPQFAKVIAVGAEKYHEHIEKVFKPPCKVGDEIVHSGFGFGNIKIDGKEHRMMPFEKVLGIKKK